MSFGYHTENLDVLDVFYGRKNGRLGVNGNTASAQLNPFVQPTNRESNHLTDVNPCICQSAVANHPSDHQSILADHIFDGQSFHPTVGQSIYPTSVHLSVRHSRPSVHPSNHQLMFI